MRYCENMADFPKHLAGMIMWLVLVPEGVWLWLSYACAKETENLLLELDHTLHPTMLSVALTLCYAYALRAYKNRSINARA